MVQNVFVRLAISSLVENVSLVISIRHTTQHPKLVSVIVDFMVTEHFVKNVILLVEDAQGPMPTNVWTVLMSASLSPMEFALNLLLVSQVCI